MTIRRHQLTGLVSRGFRDTDHNFSVSSNPTVREISPASVSEAGIKDAVFARNVPAAFATEAVVVPLSPFASDAVVTNLTPAVANFNDTTRQLTRVTDGTASLLVAVRGEIKRINIQIGRVTSATIDTFVRFLPGTLANIALTSVDSRIAGKTPSSTTLNIYSSVDHATGIYTRSASLWCADLHRKLTASCVWNSKWGQVACGTLITPQHMVGATHYNAWVEVGNVFRWVDENNITHTRTVTGVRAIPNTDTTIALLDSPLPSTIYPALVPPSGWLNLFGNLTSFGGPSGKGVPCLIRNQFGEVRVLDLTGAEVSELSPVEKSPAFSSSPAHRQPWRRNLVPGDSGSSIFMEVGHANKFMLITLGGVGANMARSTWSSHLAAIDAAAGVTTGFLPTVADLSAFPTY